MVEDTGRGRQDTPPRSPAPPAGRTGDDEGSGRASRIALYHGYELTGSGSNEYTRYLARALADLGHAVVLICAEPEPERFEWIRRACDHDRDGTPHERFARESGNVVLHRLPRTSVYPVYVTDKQRAGHVKAFTDLTAAELDEYQTVMERVVGRVLEDERPDVVHANHLVHQPVIAAVACARHGVPFHIVPHGGAVEYTIRRDPRFRQAAAGALQAAHGIAWIGREVRQRVLDLFPELAVSIEARSHMVGVGTDTGLFAPIAPADRPAALAALARLHRAGGKTSAQRLELEQALDRLDLEAARRYWDAYDHDVEDVELPVTLERLPPSALLIGFVGSLTYGKGVQSLIAAMPAIRAQHPAAHLMLVGSGTYREVLEGIVHALATGNAALLDALIAHGQDLERGDGRGALDDLAAYASDAAHRRQLLGAGEALRQHVHLCGRLDHERLRLLFPCWRLAVFPSIVKEASPLVFAEALASGVVPLGADHSGLRDGLEDLRRWLPGRLAGQLAIDAATERRVESIVERVGALLAGAPEEGRALELRRVAEERYDWRAVAARLVEVAVAVRERAVAGHGA